MFHALRYLPTCIQGEWWRLLTAVFLHGGFTHLALNMLAVHLLAPQVEMVSVRINVRDIGSACRVYFFASHLIRNVLAMQLLASQVQMVCVYVCVRACVCV